MIFSTNKSFRRVKRFFKDLSGNRWLVWHFVIAIGLITGTSSMLQQGQETADNIDNHISINAVTSYSLMDSQQASKQADTICIRSILFSLLGL
jgi:hypothetical protein